MITNVNGPLGAGTVTKRKSLILVQIAGTDPGLSKGEGNITSAQCARFSRGSGRHAPPEIFENLNL